MTGMRTGYIGLIKNSIL